MRERGLKLKFKTLDRYQECRSSCGSVDWNSFHVSEDVENIVAPHAGAWIETTLRVSVVHPGDVAPHAGAWIETQSLACYLPVPSVAPHAGAWIETQSGPNPILPPGRSSCGSVDWNEAERWNRREEICRSSCGSVDWNWEIRTRSASARVAPHWASLVVYGVLQPAPSSWEFEKDGSRKVLPGYCEQFYKTSNFCGIISDMGGQGVFFRP